MLNVVSLPVRLDQLDLLHSRNVSTMKRICPALDGRLESEYKRQTLMARKGIQKEARSPVKTAIMTFISFVLFGSIPLVSYILGFSNSTIVPLNLFYASCFMTGIAFITIGLLKSTITAKSMIREATETLLLGATAAALAYVAGHTLKQLIAG
jgi:VIT1/CCC1 family predicted Fe2+/Mn2+ transporter